MPPVLLHILYYKIKSFLKLTSELTIGAIFKNTASFLVFGGFTIGAYFFSRELIAYCLEKIHLGVFLLHRLISMVLYVFFLSVNIGNSIVAYAALYRSNETKFFLSKPVSFTQLFIVKFLDIFFYSSTTLFLIAGAVLGGYGSYFHLPWLFYFNAFFFLLIPFMLLSATLGVIMLLVLMRIAGIVGHKALLAGVVLLYAGSLFSYFSVTNPMELVNSVMKYYPFVDLYFGFLDSPLSRWLPSYWVGEAMYWTVRGNTHLAVTNFLILMVITSTAFTAMCLVAKLTYYDSWLISIEMNANSSSKDARDRFFSFSRKPKFLGNQLSALMKKEYWQFFRDPSQWIHLGIIAFLILVFIGSIRQINIRLPQPFLQTAAFLVIYLFNAFLTSSIALRFVYPMISTEGPAFWTIRSAPLSGKKFYWMKFLYAVIPLLILGEFLAVASYKPLAEQGILMFLGTASLFFLSLALIGMNLGFGAYFSNFKESNPIKVASSQGATLTFLSTIITFIMVVGILSFPLQRYFEAVAAGLPTPLQGIYFALSIVIFLSILILSVSSYIGLKAIGRDL